MNEKTFKQIGYAILRFITFFILISFVVTCSFLVFLHSVDTEQIIIKNNALLTFLNIFSLTFILWSIDLVRRIITIERPVKTIIKELDKITKGNFNVQIPYINSLTDLNKFNAIIKQINKMSAELKSVETLRNDFIANVSHELKTPLAAINNYGMLLQKSNLTQKEQIEYAKSITDTSRKLANLITNILRLNKLENQQIFQEFKPYNLSEQLCECMIGFESELEKKNIEIETDIAEDLIIDGDSELLEIVWNNLFSNAIKFTDDYGKISLTLKEEEEFASVSITDTGCGISAETGKHIFEKFYQGDTSHSSEGNGLGLAMVKRAVDIANGDIYVKSELKKGSTFTVKLRRKAN